jgi:hypothetical protein
MRRLNNRSGVSIIAVVFLIVVVAFLGVIVVSLFTTQSAQSVGELNSTQALFIADGGIEYIFRNRAFPNYSMNTYPGGGGVSSIALGNGIFQVTTPTFLTVQVNVGDTSVTVDSTSGFASPSGRIVIDSETLTYSAVGPTSFTLSAAATSSHAAGNAVYPVTTLNGAHNAITNTINVASTSGYLIPGVIKIDSECLHCTGTSSGNQFTGCTRGFKNPPCGPAAGHPGGSNVYQYVVTSTGSVSTIFGGMAQRVVRVTVD